jgi:hypothetical protein
VLYRLVKDGLVSRYHTGTGWRFFTGREALDAAHPATTAGECVRSALQADTSPFGMTTAELGAATGLTAKQVYAALSKLPGVARLGSMPDTRHFINAERAEACRPEHEAYMTALRRERQERNRQLRAERSVAYRKRLRAEGKPVVDKLRRPRKSPILTALRAALADCAEPLGLTNAQIRERTGLTSNQVTNGLLELRAAGEAFVLGRNIDTHYLPTQEHRDAAAAAFDVFMSKVKAERVARAAEVARQLSRQRYYSKAEVQARAERKAAQSKQRQPQATVLPPAKSVPASATKPNFKNLPAIVPPGLQVKQLPGCPPDYRFSVSPHFKGEFCKAGIGRYLEA